MRRITSGVLTLGLVATFGIAQALPSNASTAPPVQSEKSTTKKHDLPNPLEQKRRALRENAVAAVAKGESKVITKNGSKVVKVGEQPGRQNYALRGGRGVNKGKKKTDQYVELSQERSDKIFVILAEFGDQRHPDYPDVDTDPNTPGPIRFDGPRHNEIPQPDRAKDNSTNWKKNYNRKHFKDLYFGTGKNVESVSTYYKTQSSGRYSVDGTVSDWVKVKYNQARYGREDSGAWYLVQDAVNNWVAQQEEQGKSAEEIRATLASYDQWDRYDFDGDGDFNEPDGYIDHFQIVHAGGDEADGDPTYGEDAIWSHRWYAFGTDQGKTGPADNKLGGTEVGDTGLWVGDYTVQPENGGLSVFVHEYAHDLGLPDAYDTSGGGDNSNEYWTLMAQSRLNAKDEPLGTRPGDLGAWEKLQLGWLDYETVASDQKRKIELGPQEYNTKKAQGAVVVLPDKVVTTPLGTPASGQKQFYSGMGDDLANSMTTDLDLTGKSTASLSFKTRFEIEQDYDWAYVQASTDGGKNWTALSGTIGGTPIATDASGVPGIGGEQKEWADAVFPLDAYAGKDVKLRLYYRTDGGLALKGLFADDVVISADGTEILNDGAETENPAWTFDGFSRVGESATEDYDNFYIAGHRSYTSYDKYLKTGPYNFGWATTKPDWVEHYAYQQGLLVSYWDTSVADNNQSVHPGEGRNVIIDSHPRPIINMEGVPWRARIQMYDAPFSKAKADSMTLHINGKASYVRGQAAVPTFDDTKKYWYQELPNHGAKLPGVGVKIKVLKTKGTSMKIKIN